MGPWGVILLIGGAVLVGLLADDLVDGRLDRQWPVYTLAAGIGATLGSSFLGSASRWGPAVDGLRIVPALLGAFTIGVIIDAMPRGLARAARRPAHTP